MSNTHHTSLSPVTVITAVVDGVVVVVVVVIVVEGVVVVVAAAVEEEATPLQLSRYDHPHRSSQLNITPPPDNHLHNTHTHHTHTHHKHTTHTHTHTYIHNKPN